MSDTEEGLKDLCAVGMENISFNPTSHGALRNVDAYIIFLEAKVNELENKINELERRDNPKHWGETPTYPQYKGLSDD